MPIRRYVEKGSRFHTSSAFSNEQSIRGDNRDPWHRGGRSKTSNGRKAPLVRLAREDASLDAAELRV